ETSQPKVSKSLKSMWFWHSEEEDGGLEIWNWARWRVNKFDCFAEEQLLGFAKGPIQNEMECNKAGALAFLVPPTLGLCRFFGQEKKKLARLEGGQVREEAMSREGMRLVETLTGVHRRPKTFVASSEILDPQVWRASSLPTCARILHRLREGIDEEDDDELGGGVTWLGSTGGARGSMGRSTMGVTMTKAATMTSDEMTQQIKIQTPGLLKFGSRGSLLRSRLEQFSKGLHESVDNGGSLDRTMCIRTVGASSGTPGCAGRKAFRGYLRGTCSDLNNASLEMTVFSYERTRDLGLARRPAGASRYYVPLATAEIPLRGVPGQSWECLVLEHGEVKANMRAAPWFFGLEEFRGVKEDIGESQGNRFVSVCGNGCRERDAVLVVHLKAPAWQSQRHEKASVVVGWVGGSAAARANLPCIDGASCLGNILQHENVDGVRAGQLSAERRREARLTGSAAGFSRQRGGRRLFLGVLVRRTDDFSDELDLRKRYLFVKVIKVVPDRVVTPDTRPTDEIDTFVEVTFDGVAKRTRICQDDVSPSFNDDLIFELALAKTGQGTSLQEDNEATWEELERKGPVFIDLWTVGSKANEHLGSVESFLQDILVDETGQPQKEVSRTARDVRLKRQEQTNVLLLVLMTMMTVMVMETFSVRAFRGHKRLKFTWGPGQGLEYARVPSGVCPSMDEYARAFAEAFEEKQGNWDTKADDLNGVTEASTLVCVIPGKATALTGCLVGGGVWGGSRAMIEHPLNKQQEANTSPRYCAGCKFEHLTFLELASICEGLDDFNKEELRNGRQFQSVAKSIWPVESAQEFHQASYSGCWPVLRRLALKPQYITNRLPGAPSLSDLHADGGSELLCLALDSRTHRYTSDEVQEPLGELSVQTLLLATSLSAGGLILLQHRLMTLDSCRGSPDSPGGLEHATQVTLSPGLDALLCYLLAEDPLLLRELRSTLHLPIPEAAQKFCRPEDRKLLIDPDNWVSILNAEPIFEAVDAFAAERLQLVGEKRAQSRRMAFDHAVTEAELGLLSGAAQRAFSSGLFSQSAADCSLAPLASGAADEELLGLAVQELVACLAERFLQRAVSAGFSVHLSQTSDGDLKLADSLLAKLSPPSRKDLEENPLGAEQGYGYWAPHIDKANVPDYDVSAILYLSTMGEQFSGGAFAFNDADADRIVEPKMGRLLLFDSGPSNLHQVYPVLSGTRLALSVWFSRLRPGEQKAKAVDFTMLTKGPVKTSITLCCTINWFREWPAEALSSVAQQQLTVNQVQLPNFDGSVKLFQVMHMSVEQASKKFLEQNKRHVYNTPTSYLELLSSFISVLAMKRKQVGTQQKRYKVGLEKIGDAEEQVSGLQQMLVEKKPKLEQTQKMVEEMMKVIEVDKAAAQEVSTKVAKEEAEAQREVKVLWSPWAILRFIT
ncbi:DNAH7, partial [Symbiodinium microadriaticum]